MLAVWWWEGSYDSTATIEIMYINYTTTKESSHLLKWPKPHFA